MSNKAPRLELTVDWEPLTSSDLTTSPASLLSLIHQPRESQVDRARAMAQPSSELSDTDSSAEAKAEQDWEDVAEDESGTSAELRAYRGIYGQLPAQHKQAYTRDPADIPCLRRHSESASRPLQATPRTRDVVYLPTSNTAALTARSWRERLEWKRAVDEIRREEIGTTPCLQRKEAARIGPLHITPPAMPRANTEPLDGLPSRPIAAARLRMTKLLSYARGKAERLRGKLRSLSAYHSATPTMPSKKWDRLCRMTAE